MVSAWIRANGVTMEFARDTELQEADELRGRAARVDREWVEFSALVGMPMQEGHGMPQEKMVELTFHTLTTLDTGLPVRYQGEEYGIVTAQTQRMLGEDVTFYRARRRLV